MIAMIDAGSFKRLCEWELVRIDGMGLFEPIKFMLRAKAFVYVEAMLNRDIPGWRSEAKVRVLEVHKRRTKWS